MHLRVSQRTIGGRNFNNLRKIIMNVLKIVALQIARLIEICCIIKRSIDLKERNLSPSGKRLHRAVTIVTI